jgi:hypothetical protein
LFVRPCDARPADRHSALRLDALRFARGERPKDMAPKARIQVCDFALSAVEGVERSSRVADGLTRWLIFARIGSVNVTSSLFSKCCTFAQRLHRLVLRQLTLNYLKDKVYRKAYCMVTLYFEWKGVVMTGEEKGEKAVTQSRPQVDARAGIAGIARGDRARHARSSERDEQAAMPTSPNIVVAEQWLCFLLGFICVACGGWGICMKYSLDLSSGYISWLGSAYGPTLRFTAVACLVSGAVLLRRGLARPDMSSVSGSRKVLRYAGGNSIRNAKRTPVRRMS